MKNKTAFLRYAFRIILILIFVNLIFTAGLYLSLFNCSKICYGNENQELLRIKIYGSSSTEEGSTVSGTVSIIDSNGNEIAVVERSWSGAYLSVDFSQSKFNNNYYIFPGTIFGKNRIFDIKKSERKGTDLSRYYNENGQCMLLGYGSYLKQRKAMYRIANFTLGKYPVLDFFKKTTTLSLDLSGCRTGYYYSISSTENGDLVVSEL